MNSIQRWIRNASNNFFSRLGCLRSLREEPEDGGLLRSNPRRSRSELDILVLLLGAAGSGKTTLIKQIRIMNKQSFNEREMHFYRVTVLRNVSDALHSLYIDYHEILDSKYPAVNFSAILQYLALWASWNAKRQDYDPLSTGQMANTRNAFADFVVRNENVLKQRYNIDQLSYFLENMCRICKQDYQPNDNDILRCRSSTNSIELHKVRIGSHPFTFIDVGGQRGQRAQWFQCFKKAQSIIFVASASDFDEFLAEDSSVLRLKESIDLFHAISNNIWLKAKGIILLINKNDLLERKIKNSNISEFANGFNGDPRRLADVQYFIGEQFKSARHKSNRDCPLYIHFTTMIDTDLTIRVFESIKKVILTRNVERLMLE